MAQDAFQPGVITFRPDNFLTVGVIGAIVYLAAVALVQGLNRAGLIKLGSAAPVPAGAVATT